FPQRLRRGPGRGCAGAAGGGVDRPGPGRGGLNGGGFHIGMTGFLGQALLYIVPFLLVLTFIVTIHELGHFLVARAFGVKIDRFSVGFGKTIVSRIDRRGTEWRLAWLPLGGYVKFSDDPDASALPDDACRAEPRQPAIAETRPG